ncbi:hypothetical protein [Clostridium sp.]|uniref:PTS sugar transporter subunit IIA n=1 Tax=Clostridium sp. TaxID=1506 RepID=UPI0025BB60EC|nr:hypothetical protein [Clostridium sp.]
MYKIVLASHGNFSNGILDTIHFFTKDTENVYKVILDESGIDNFENKIISIFNEISDSNVLILVDLFHGTPFNVCTNNIGLINGDVDIVAGVNVPIFLDALLNSTSLSVSEEIENIKNMNVINILSEEFRNQINNNDDE